MILPVRILAVSGSLQARSSNRALLRTAHRVAPAGVDVVDSISASDIPPFNPDLERDGPAPAGVVEWRAVVVVSATVGVVAADKGADELRDPAAVEAVVAALGALTDRSG